jgi:predicted transcriptional regulator of viral defense system
LTDTPNAEEDYIVPRSRFDELAALAEENDGLVTADHARHAGFTDSVLARLVQRGRIERTSRGVYRVPYLTPGRFSQYQEAVLWAKANRGPAHVAISHMTALAAYEISDANPHSIHITVPKTARLRRQRAKGIVVHREDLMPEDITIHEGMPLTTIARTIADLLKSGERIDLIRQAISDARREGFIQESEARKLRRRVEEHLKSIRTANSKMEPAIT